jgi:hypothetical protein
MNFNSRFKLEFDIKTNSDNMADILKVIVDTIGKETNEMKKYIELEITPTITKIDV